MSGDAKSLIKQLLVSDARNRLGYGPNGGKDVKNHHFFDAINWEKLLKKEIPPPLGFKPVVVCDVLECSRSFYRNQIWIRAISMLNSPINQLLTLLCRMHH